MRLEPLDVVPIHELTQSGGGGDGKRWGNKLQSKKSTHTTQI
jgi:hypothetical protein